MVLPTGISRESTRRVAAAAPRTRTNTMPLRSVTRTVFESCGTEARDGSPGKVAQAEGAIAATAAVVATATASPGIVLRTARDVCLSPAFGGSSGAPRAPRPAGEADAAYGEHNRSCGRVASMPALLWALSLDVRKGEATPQERPSHPLIGPWNKRGRHSPGPGLEDQRLTVSRRRCSSLDEVGLGRVGEDAGATRRRSPCHGRADLTGELSSRLTGRTQGIEASRAYAGFVGPSDLGAWGLQELAFAPDRSAGERDLRVFPILLPGVREPFDPTVLPHLLRTRTWVDYRRAGTCGRLAATGRVLGTR